MSLVEECEKMTKKMPIVYHYIIISLHIIHIIVKNIILYFLIVLLLLKERLKVAIP